MNLSDNQNALVLTSYKAQSRPCQRGLGTLGSGDMVGEG